MSITRCCSLCCTACTAYKFLQNDMGESNKIYEVAVKYFDPMLLTDEENISSEHTQVICESCWFHISDFHEFQQTVLEARMLWKDKKYAKSLHIQVKEEDDQSSVHQNENVEGNEALFKDDCLENQNFKTESPTSFDDIPIKNTNGEELLHKQIKISELPIKVRHGRKPKSSNKILINSDDSALEVYMNNKQKKLKLSGGTKQKGSSSLNLEKARESDAFIAQWTKELVCDLCSETESNFDNLRSHFKENHKTKFYIKCCERKFFRRSVFVNHIQLHLNPDIHKCDICGKSSSTKNNLKLHKQMMHENTKEKGSSSLNLEKARELDAFIAQWKPELVCDLCSEIEKNFDKLRSHFKANHKTKFYIKCCERKFFRRSDLVNHIQLHLNPEIHKCDICGKSSSTKNNLKLHKKVMHEDTKQLKCDICEKLFKQKVTLKRHLLTHDTGSKDFICSECGNGYVAKQLLKIHIKHVHNDDRICDQCGKTIHGFRALKKHLMEHAGIERPKFTCDICGLELKSSNGIKRHKAAYHNDGSTIYVCGVCGKVAASENALRNHKKLVHIEERKHKCTFCEKAFKRPKTLREHIATHTGQDLYQCPHCPQTFKVSANMYHHRKKVHPVEWGESHKNRLQQPKINLKQVKKQVVL